MTPSRRIRSPGVTAGRPAGVLFVLVALGAAAAELADMVQAYRQAEATTAAGQRVRAERHGRAFLGRPARGAAQGADRVRLRYRRRPS